MKVLTLNTHAWMEEHPVEKIEKIVDWIAANDYAFVTLQEVNQSMDAEEVSDAAFVEPSGDDLGVEIKADNFAWLIVKGLRERGLEYNWSWTASHIGFETYDEGVAVLSKAPFEAENLLVSTCNDYTHHYTRRILKAKTSGEQENWTVVSVHYSWWKDDEGNELFRHEWNRTINFLKEEAETSLLVMGDFNNEDSVIEEGYDYLKKTAPYLSDAFSAAEKRTGEATVTSAIHGWDDHTEDKRIDYIFADSKHKIACCRVVLDDRNGPVVSDHFGVEVELIE